MDLKWLSLIYLFSAVCGVSVHIPHQYHFVNEAKNWTEAQSYCRQKYTDLATVSNMEEMKMLSSTLQNKATDYVWIGLNRVNPGRWQWSLGDGDMYREGVEYRNWSSGEPNNAVGSEFCVAMQKYDGTWVDVICGHQYSFVCYDVSGNKAHNQTYRFISDAKTWREAQSYCRDNYTDLTSVRDQSDNQQIWSMTTTSSSNNVWIGLFNDSWQWSDQSISSFRYWQSGQPNNLGGFEKCAAVYMEDQGQWHDVNCECMNPFICYQNKLVLVNLTLTWWDALRYCRENHRDLVSVHSEKVQSWVMEVAQKASTDHVWLGLRHTCRQGFWFWVSGFSICYQNWAPGNGTGGEDCGSGERSGALDSSGGQQWVSLPETQQLNFICTNY
ncbi:C-type mannose receptor 2-like [Hoplias malabaricus]|uniref:C-type mannose receptor 2-like n=1 Tax=Hoplias malabaricus TaxID=27720 RepID=UPI0034637D3C